MKTRGIDLEIPGWGELRLQHALFDLNGTLALDGILSSTVKKRLQMLQEKLGIHIVTADTHGTAADLMRGCGAMSIERIQIGNEAQQKCDILEKMGASQTVALGNGANDALMLRKASLGICVMQGEGASLQALLASDVLARSADEALDLLLKPYRLLATLRS